MQTPRAHPRYQTSLSMEIFTGKEMILAIAKNLSMGGAGVATAVALPEHAAVGLSMFLVVDGIEDAQTEPLNVQAQVVWCAPDESSGGFLAGLRFAELSPPNRQALETFLRQLAGG